MKTILYKKKIPRFDTLGSFKTNLSGYFLDNLALRGIIFEDFKLLTTSERKFKLSDVMDKYDFSGFIYCLSKSMKDSKKLKLLFISPVLMHLYETVNNEDDILLLTIDNYLEDVESTIKQIRPVYNRYLDTVSSFLQDPSISNRIDYDDIKTLLSDIDHNTYVKKYYIDNVDILHLYIGTGKYCLEVKKYLNKKIIELFNTITYNRKYYQTLDICRSDTYDKYIHQFTLYEPIITDIQMMSEYIRQKGFFKSLYYYDYNHMFGISRNYYQSFVYNGIHYINLKRNKNTFTELVNILKDIEEKSTYIKK